MTAAKPEAWESPRFAAYKMGYLYAREHPLTRQEAWRAEDSFAKGLEHGSEDHVTHFYADADDAEVIQLRSKEDGRR